MSESHGSTEEPIRNALADLFGRARARLDAIAATSRVNALLALADPALVLPSPALGLIAVEPVSSRSLGPSHRFRSLGHAGPWGEIVLTALDPAFEAHPWRIERCSWIDESGSEPRSRATEARIAGGVELCLERDAGTPCGPGWLSLHLEGGPWLAWALETALATAGERPLGFESATESLTRARGALPPHAWPSWHEIGELAQGVRLVQVPSGLIGETRLVLRLHFAEPIPVPAEPEAHANVALVWNSLAHLYPDPAEIAARVSQERRQMVHRLSTRSVGPGWVPWSVDRVRPADEHVGLGGVVSRFGGEPFGLGEEYRLAFAPESFDPTQPGMRAAAMSVVLTPSGRRRLDRRDQRLHVDFRVTQGEAGNHVAAGTSFELVDAADPFGGGVASGKSLVETLGGSDGLPASLAATEDLDVVQALMPCGRARSVTDVMGALHLRFGDELELVNAWDLLRTSTLDETEPLAIRVRFARTHRPRHERRIVLRACESFLNQYLGPTATGGLRLVDVDAAREEIA